MNIAYRYGAIYWKCGCLIVNSASDTDKSTNYGKIASAVADLRDTVEPPSINNSRKGFSVKGDKILYGLKPITKLSDTDIEQIINNRPFSSFQDFRCRTEIGDGATINLIKSGCFDELHPNREELLYSFIEEVTNTKNKLTSSNINDLVEHGILSKEEFENDLRYVSVYKFICSKPNLVDMKSEYGLKGQWYKVDSQYENQFLDLYNSLEVDKDYIYCSQGMVVKKSSMEKVKKAKSERISDILASKETLDSLNCKLIEANIDKLAHGRNRARWEMDSMYYYYTNHELDKVDLQRYALSDFSRMNTSPNVVDTGFNKKGVQWFKYDTSLIAGTVLNSEKDKGFITIQTQTGVVNIRVPKGVFNHYNKNISIMVNGKKKKIDGSWFTRGNMIIVQGFRRDDEFIPKHYTDSVFSHSIIKIQEIQNNGQIVVQMERIRTE